MHGTIDGADNAIQHVARERADDDIVDIETSHAVFSSASALVGITIRDVAPDLRRESFIAMDPPRHSAQRKTVAPMLTPTILTSSQSTSASAPPNAWTACLQTMCSIGSTASRSNSPRRCLPCCSTFPGRSAAS